MFLENRGNIGLDQTTTSILLGRHHQTLKTWFLFYEKHYTMWEGFVHENARSIMEAMEKYTTMSVKDVVVEELSHSSTIEASNSDLFS